VCRTFGEPLPAGVKRCVSAADYGTLPEAAEIRRSARKRFSWKSNLEVLTEAVERAAAGR
jgi:hypothetical protein